MLKSRTYITQIASWGGGGELQKIMSAGLPFPNFFRKKGGGVHLFGICAVKQGNTVVYKYISTWCWILTVPANQHGLQGSVSMVMTTLAMLLTIFNPFIPIAV